jgi:toxin ParE1/3/4
MPSEAKAVRLHAEARSELRDSVAFYRERAGERWAVRFKLRVAEGLKAIAAKPERYPPAPDLPGVQKLRLRQFPFSLLYINRTDYVWVVAVAHGSRKPGYWKERVS